MTTFTLAVIGYIETFPKQSGLTLEQVRAVLEQHPELTSARVRLALTWAEQSSTGETWQTNTDLQMSDQADIYLIKA